MDKVVRMIFCLRLIRLIRKTLYLLVSMERIISLRWFLWLEFDTRHSQQKFDHFSLKLQLKLLLNCELNCIFSHT
jgi:hypothetical protein